MEKKDWIDELDDQIELEHPEYREERPKVSIVAELIALRKRLGLTQRQVAQRMGVATPRVNEIEIKPWKASWDRIYHYAGAMGADLVLRMPDGLQEELAVAESSTLQNVNIPDLVKALEQMRKAMNDVDAPKPSEAMAVRETRLPAKRIKG